MKRILLSVLGLSPQVITEALYALFMQGRLVDELHVITTKTGWNLVHSGLLASGQGAFFDFLNDYNIPHNKVSFPPENIHVLEDERGKKINDIVTPEDNEVLVKKCMELSWELTKNPNQEVYFLISGGRKTMSACLALAAQFYGRPCDRIYHVLVSSGFENCEEFYFPPPNPRLIQTTDHQGKICYRNTKDAEVWLVSMPFVSARDRLSEGELNRPQPPEKLLACLIRDNPPKLIIDLEGSKITFKGREIDPPPANQIALLTFFAFLKKKCGCNSSTSECDNCFLSLDKITENPKNKNIIRDIYEQICKNRPTFSYGSQYGIASLDASNFATYRSKLNKYLEKQFGSYAREIQIQSFGKKNNKKYGIILNADFIEIVNYDKKKINFDE